MTKPRAIHPRNAFAGRLRRRYGLSVEEFAWLWYAQGGCCAICGLPLNLDKPAMCNVDHEHGPKRKKKKPKVRGLLHNYCNYKYLGHVERGGATRYWNAGVYLGWAAPQQAFTARTRSAIELPANIVVTSVS